MVEKSLTMADGIHHDILKIVYSREAEDAFRRCKAKDQPLFQRLEKQMNKILHDPGLGKPLRYTLKNRRRFHISSFVLV